MKLWRRKKIYVTFVVIPQTAKVTATVDGKSLVQTENTLNLYSKIFWEWGKETTFT